MTAPTDPGQGNRWADCGVCVEVPTVTGWALGRQDRCPVHGRQPFPDGEQSQFDGWRPPQEMVDDLVEAWHAQPDQLLDDYMRNLLRRWRAQGRLADYTPDPATVALIENAWLDAPSCSHGAQLLLPNPSPCSECSARAVIAALGARLVPLGAREKWSVACQSCSPDGWTPGPGCAVCSPVPTTPETP